MRQRVVTIWRDPLMERWGRLLLGLAAVMPFFVYFLNNRSAEPTRNDETILISITATLAIGIVASTATTERYTARSLGLYIIILGACIYYFYLYLAVKGNAQLWMADLTRACFVIGAPLFAISTVVALISRVQTWFHHRRRYANSD